MTEETFQTSQGAGFLQDDPDDVGGQRAGARGIPLLPGVHARPAQLAPLGLRYRQGTSFKFWLCEWHFLFDSAAWKLDSLRGTDTYKKQRQRNLSLSFRA